MSSFLLRVCLMMTAIGTLAYSKSHSTRKPIGTGIEVNVRVLYDDGVAPSASYTEDHNVGSQPIGKKFEEIFQKVQEKFKQENVLIKVNAPKVKPLKNKDIRVLLNGSTTELDGQRTLLQLVKTQKQHISRKNEIVYFFTKTGIFSQGREDDNLPIRRTNVQTRGTFCSTNVSAAVVMYYEKEPEDFPFRATALIFGSTREFSLKSEDFKYMNDTFARCNKNVDTESTDEQNAH
uniref:28 kDa Metastriate family member n=1 Tax=Rhipicephalus appendiculatus TaxID=34631 RepID=A0A131YEA1_RHIAP